jgi:maltooligosyltrehalose synthase
MTDQQSTTDTTYNLISVIYHALQAVDTYHTYLRDAEETGDTELTGLLTGAIQHQRDLATQAKELLAQRLSNKEGAA